MKISWLMTVLILLALLAGCNLNSQPQATSTSTTIAATVPPTPTTIPTQVDPQEIQNTFEDPAHGFAFTYSGLWTLIESTAEDMDQNKILQLQMDSVLLEIEYGFQFEFNGLQPLTLPLGEVTSQESVDFLGQPLPQTAVMEDDRIKMVMCPAETDVFQIDDLFFRITLQETGPLAQNEIDLSGMPLDETQAILGSFVRIERSAAPSDPYPGWNTYLNVGHGFMLRYPTDWQAEEMQVEVSPAAKENAVVLIYEHTNLMLIYDFNENYLPEDVQFLGGLLVDQGNATFLGRQIQKLALVYNEKVKEILYNGLEPFQADTLTFRISLMDNRAGLGYDQLEVTDPALAEADSILLTARQFPAALTPPEAGLQSEGKEIFLTFQSCFDLDEGQQVAADDPTCDFLTASATGGGGLRITFEPAAPAVFGFDSVFVEQPQPSQCAGAAGMSSQAETIAPLDSYHICYQTNAGRYGYLIFRALTSDGVSFDWQTFTIAGPLGFSASQQNVAITRRDVTVPDGTVFAPGETFEKTWELMNTGTTTWTTDYAIRFQDGNRLGAPYEVPMPHQVAPGRSVNVSVQMVAPQEPGTYRSDWVLRDAQGRPFGVGNNETFWVEIVVEEENPPEEEEETQSEDTSVVETTLKVDPASFTGTCPATLTVNFSISTEGTDHYTYELQAGAAQTGFQFYMPDPTEVSLGGSGPNTKVVEYTLTMQNSVEGWLQLVVTDPGEHRSQKVYFTVVCE